MGKICTIGDCNNRHIGRGMCIKHYTRWRTHGNPLTVDKSGGWTPKRYFESSLDFNPDNKGSRFVRRAPLLTKESISWLDGQDEQTYILAGYVERMENGL
jgi:hypothetical protein